MKLVTSRLRISLLFLLSFAIGILAAESILEYYTTAYNNVKSFGVVEFMFAEDVESFGSTFEEQGTGLPLGNRGSISWFVFIIMK